jgi:transposase
MTATRTLPASVSEPTLYVAFELGAKNWKLGLTAGFGIEPWVQTVGARDWPAVRRVLERARARFGLVASGRVVSCYEAGRDGFWIHRALLAQGLANRVVDSASIEVSRRSRRSKTDRIDARKLVQMLVRACLGDTHVWREVHVPPVAVEAARHVSRERSQLVAEQTRFTNQVQSLLTTYGAVRPKRRTGAWWTTVRDWSGAALPAPVQARLARLEARMAIVASQLAEVDATQQHQRDAVPEPDARSQLVRLKGIATTSASVLIDEGLVWRAFRNRRQVGGFVGFRPVPYASGEQARDQGIDRAGNRRLRAVSIQLAWNWIRWQPLSALTRWYARGFASRGNRARRIGVVALARRLLIALWRYATTGAVPDGAVLKAA